jgi:hypothetical protein
MLDGLMEKEAFVLQTYVHSHHLSVSHDAAAATTGPLTVGTVPYMGTVPVPVLHTCRLRRCLTLARRPLILASKWNLESLHAKNHSALSTAFEI